MKYLIPEFSGIGDLIQKTPLIASITELDSEASIFIIGDNRWGALEVIDGSPMIKEVCNLTRLLNLRLPKVYTNKEVVKLYRKLSYVKKRRLKKWLADIEWDVFLDSSESDVPAVVIDMIETSKRGLILSNVDTSNSHRSSVLDHLVGRKKRLESKFVPLRKQRHDIDLNYDLLEAYVGNTITRTYNTWISLSSCPVKPARSEPFPKQYICLQPGAANGSPTPKRWNPTNFIDLSSRIIKKYSYGVVLLGDQGDSKKIIEKYEWPDGVINLAGRTTVSQVCSLIKNAMCVVAHDSGIMHLANAMTVPLVALYGPTDHVRTRPFGLNSKILYSRTRAFSIMSRTEKSEEKLADEYPNYEAMDGISVDDVENVVQEFVGRNAIDE
ncbi:MAG: glycosyltransferase family 9 protein [Chloroflexota bacterium]|nr:glycosyltransferase family 9 protein [Chloroflexota bacterium]